MNTNSAFILPPSSFRLEFINLRENAKIGDLMFSAKNASSNHSPVDDESSDLVAFNEISVTT